VEKERYVNTKVSVNDFFMNSDRLFLNNPFLFAGKKKDKDCVVQ
jgi:hypothetical protein